MKFKRIISAVMAAGLCILPITQATAAAAESYSIVSPLYEIAHKTESLLYIDGSTATCKSSATSISAVKITVEQTLQKKSYLLLWLPYDETSIWTKTVNTNVIYMSNTKSGLTSGTYRVKSVFTLTDKYGKTETITTYSTEETVP